jgi:hypothetical protein
MSLLINSLGLYYVVLIHNLPVRVSMNAALDPESVKIVMLQRFSSVPESLQANAA